MINSAPDYYQESRVYAAIQQAVADEIDYQESNSNDLEDQLYIETATWGLKYWEEEVGIPTNTADSYEVRRSRVLSKWRGFGNFSGSLVKKVCEAFTNGEVTVTVNIATGIVTITFIGARGLPPNLSDLQATLDDIVHAHLSLAYVFTYITWAEFDAKNWTFNTLDGFNYTWDQLEALH